MAKNKETKQKVKSKQEEKALRLLNEMEDIPITSEEIEEIRSIVGKKQLAAFLVGTSWPEVSYKKIAGVVGVSPRSIYEWRQDDGFRKEVKRYGEEYIEREWLPIVRAQMRKALSGDTEAFNAIARVLGKGVSKHEITAYTPEMKRLEEMTDEELEIYIAELRAERDEGNKGGCDE